MAVSASLRNDEVTEFPEEEEEAVAEEIKGPDKQLVMLADYLNKTGQSVFEFFKSIDLDDSGNIDFELQQALIKSDVGEYHPWEVEALVAAVDLDKDGKLNLPELSIALAQIASNYGTPSETGEEATEDSAEETNSEHTEGSLSKLKKAELVAIAEEMGVATTGTKSDLVAAILGA